MAWNGSSGGYSKRPVVTKGKQSGNRRLFLILSSALVLASVLVLCLIDKSETVPAHQESPVEKRKPIVHAEPEITVKAPEPAPPEPKLDPSARPTKVGEVVNGYVMLPSGRIHKPTGVVTNRVADYAKSPYSIFPHRSDNEIAAILMMKPGDTLVGTKRYDKWFTQQFLKSIETPIIVQKDDEPWQADLKRSVIQAKLDLKDAYDRGEDIEAIMAESRQQLQDLARYKQTLKQVYAQSLKECDSPEKVESLQIAVNKMLEEKGCAPMNFTPLTKQNLMKDKTYE